MKTFLFFLLAAANSLNAGAQKIRFTDNSNMWQQGVSCFGSNSSPFYRFAGDTVYQGNSYKKMSYNFPPYYIWIREDAAANKVYAAVPIDSPERLLYDFSLKMGDPGVLSVDSFQHNNIWHKAWSLAGTLAFNASGSYKVFEGIGCANGPLMPLNPDPDCSYTLTCFRNLGVVPNYPFPRSCMSLGLPGIAGKEEKIVIVPLPAGGDAKMLFPDVIAEGLLSVYDSDGRRIAQAPLRRVHDVAIGQMLRMPGLYCYTVQDLGQGRMFSGRFSFLQ